MSSVSFPLIWKIQEEQDSTFMSFSGLTTVQVPPFSSSSQQWCNRFDWWQYYGSFYQFYRWQIIYVICFEKSKNLSWFGSQSQRLYEARYRDHISPLTLIPQWNRRLTRRVERPARNMPIALVSVATTRFWTYASAVSSRLRGEGAVQMKLLIWREILDDMRCIALISTR